MLPTKQTSDILLLPNGFLVFQEKPMLIEDESFVHLYILSNEEIKGDDFVYRINSKDVVKVDSFLIHLIKQNSTELCKKIIASTDSSLKIEIDGNRGNLLPDVSFDIELPKISKSVIEYYVTEYNKGNVITKVLVECYFTHETEEDKFLSFKISNNNEVAISTIVQETLEEAAARTWSEKNSQYNPFAYKIGFIEGAKLQSERIEEDLKEAYFAGIKSTAEGWNGEYAGSNNPDIKETFSEGFDEWYEQFKKK
jgi:hypothetical protein